MSGVISIPFAIILGVASLGLLIWGLLPTIKRVRITLAPIPPLNIGTQSKNEGVIYYSNRDALKATVAKELQDTAVAHVLWFTGWGARGTKVHVSGKVKRMLLIHPKLYSQPPISTFISQRSGGRTPEEEALTLLAFAKEAHNAGVNVKWLRIVPNYLFVVSDFNTPHAWIRIEHFDLAKDSNGWESLRIHKDKHPFLFDALLWQYDLLWEKGEEPYWENLKVDTMGA